MSYLCRPGFDQLFGMNKDVCRVQVKVDKCAVLICRNFSKAGTGKNRVPWHDMSHRRICKSNTLRIAATKTA